MGRQIRRVLATASEEFWSLVDKSGGEDACWPWTGSTIEPQPGDVRGVFYAENNKRYAHRLAWFFTHGCWPEPQANHTCDNSLCCNVLHLYEGTQQENVRDREERGRRKSPKGETNGRAVLSAAQVEEIRRVYQPGGRGEFSSSSIARRYGVHKNTIKNIATGKTWS